METKRINKFVISHSFTAHPLKKANEKTRVRYYAVLAYLVSKSAQDIEYANARLAQCRAILVEEETTIVLTDENRDGIIRSVVNNWLKPWTRKYPFWLMCDMALISVDRHGIEKAQEFLARYLSKRQRTLLAALIDAFFTTATLPWALMFAENLINQIRINHEFVAQLEKRILVAANMSAGKSTLINALIGKPLTRTAQEACTGNLCYLFNKPFEDDSLHLLASPLNLDASYIDLMQAEKTSVSYIASYFRALVPQQPRVCLIDTPGVNSAINRDHGKLTREALTSENYNKLIYVLNANRLGTDEEFRFLNYVSEKVPKDKVIFVLNKLDDFKRVEDSIPASIEGLRNDLIQIGFEDPVICPLSAYFALLLKMKWGGEDLNEDEQDAYRLYAKKFSRAEYDLSIYYKKAIMPVPQAEDGLPALALKCGLYGLESIVYGGEDK